MNPRRTYAIARKEILHIVRDTRSLIAAIMQPFNGAAVVRLCPQPGRGSRADGGI